LILSAPLRSDRIFGFRMFPEASTLEIHLARELRGRTIPAPRGEWRAPDRAGILHEFAWRDRIHDPVLGALDARSFASYGAETQLARLQRALDDVADHIPDDTETARLQADVLVWKNGREPVTVSLSSHLRPEM
jgi:hypothetical protein